jgi:hypothetical protein
LRKIKMSHLSHQRLSFFISPKHIDHDRFENRTRSKEKKPMKAKRERTFRLSRGEKRVAILMPIDDKWERTDTG